MLRLSCRKKLALVLLALLIGAPPSRGQTARKRLEADAARLPMLQLDGYMNFEGQDSETPLKARVLHEQLIKELFEADLPIKELVPLLKHMNPKVRTLAIMALIDKEDPKVLPDIFSLVKDKAETFGRPPRNMRAITAFEKPPPEIKTMPKLSPQTVGDVAEMAIGMYLRSAEASDFEKYWAVRKDRDYCLSWFSARVRRAYQSLELTRNHVARLKAIRKDIDRLPPDDRAWTLLALGLGVDGKSITDKELVTHCQQLGPAKLMKMLTGEKFSEDPDMQAPRGTDFVLKHAKELLTKDAADPLMKLADERSKEGGDVHLWYLAAVSLQPDRADIRKTAVQNLKDALKAPRDKWDAGFSRGAGAQTLWTIGGSAESKSLVEWFYTEKRSLSYSPYPDFLDHVALHRPPENRAMLALLVRDPRFDKLDWESLDRMIQILNRWTKPPIMTDEERDSLRGPNGMRFSQWALVDEQEMRRFDPEDIARLNKTLAQWRQKVRDSIPQWNDVPREKQFERK